MILKTEAECPKCGKFDDIRDDKVDFHFIVCPKCNDQLGAIFKPNSPEGIEYQKRFIAIREYEI